MRFKQITRFGDCPGFTSLVIKYLDEEQLTGESLYVSSQIQGTVCHSWGVGMAGRNSKQSGMSSPQPSSDGMSAHVLLILSLLSLFFYDSEPRPIELGLPILMNPADKSQANGT